MTIQQLKDELRRIHNLKPITNIQAQLRSLIVQIEDEGVTDE